MKAVPHTTVNRLFADSPFLLAICSKDICLKWFNPLWETLASRSKRELKGIPLLDLIHPDDRSGFSEAIQVTRNCIAPAPFRARMTSRDGNHPLLEWHIVNHSESQKNGAVSVYGHDVSRLRDAEVKFANSRSELQDLQCAIDQAAIVTVTDPNGNILYANRKFSEASQFSTAEVIGKNHRFFNSGYHPKAFFDDLWNTVSAGRVWRGEIRNRRKDNSFFWMDTTIIPFMDGQRCPYKFMSIRTDITEKKKFEEKQALEQARRVYLGRLAAVGEVAAGIGHEINNPLAAILMNAQLIRKLHGEERLTSEQFLEMIERIEKTSRRIETIVHSLKTLSRNGDGDPFQQSSLTGIVQDALELCRARFERAKIAFKVGDIRPDLSLECRPVQISQIILNLLNNAFDAVAGGEPRWVRLEFSETDHSVEISVYDSGSGVAPDIRRKIMQPFFTTKEVGKGTGLGLSISRGIAERHQGSLFLDTDCPSTRFVLKLPKQISQKSVGVTFPMETESCD